MKEKNKQFGSTQKMRAEPWEMSQRNKRLYEADSLAKQTLLSQAGIYLPVTRRTKYWEEYLMGDQPSGSGSGLLIRQARFNSLVSRHYCGNQAGPPYWAYCNSQYMDVQLSWQSNGLLNRGSKVRVLLYPPLLVLYIGFPI